MSSKKQPENHPKYIGIVAVSAPGAVLCYQTIIAESEKILGARKHPEITLTHPTFNATRLLTQKAAGNRSRLFYQPSQNYARA